MHENAILGDDRRGRRRRPKQNAIADEFEFDLRTGRQCEPVSQGLGNNDPAGGINGSFHAKMVWQLVFLVNRGRVSSRGGNASFTVSLGGFMRTGSAVGILLTIATTSLAVQVAAAAPRAARSVHLGYPAPPAAACVIEMTVRASTAGSYFMAAGWDTGYFGIQELAGGRKVIIFSVWDPTRGDNPEAVAAEDRVACLFQADDVRIKRFGGEGTGGQCMGDFPWVLGQSYRFLVTAAVEADQTAYAGYVWQNDAASWKHLVTFQTRTGGRPLRGLYSFVEDFRRDGRSVEEVRRAEFAHAWVKPAAGGWQPLRRARFTASSAEWEAQDSIDAGLAGAGFFLATGGDTAASRGLGSIIELPAAAEPGEPPPLP